MTRDEFESLVSSPPFPSSFPGIADETWAGRRLAREGPAARDEGARESPWWDEGERKLDESRPAPLTDALPSQAEDIDQVRGSPSALIGPT